MNINTARRAREELRAAWREQGWYPALTVGQALAAAAHAHGLDTLIFVAVDGPTATVTLSRLWERAQETARRLAGIGLRRGDAVVLQAPADTVSTEVMIALWSLGAVLVPLTATASHEEVGHAIRETGAEVIIVAGSWRGRGLTADLVADASTLRVRHVVVLGDDHPPGTTQLRALAEVPIPPAAADEPSGVACVIYTSGSTASPKGVQHTHESLLCGLGAVPVDPSSRFLGMFPAGHVASLLGLLRPLTAGGTTVLMDRWSPRVAVELIEEHRISVSAGTPFFLASMLDEAERSGRDISSLTGFLVGAAAVPPSLVERSEAAGIVAWRTYGSTEHPAISAGSPNDPPEKRRLTDGRLGPGNEVRLVDPQGNDVPPGEEGEIIARGPKQFVGYQDPRADVDAFVDATWFRTGDLGFLDNDGYLVVTDRVKDIIIRGGENISAREIEDVVARHPAVKEVAVCAAPDEVWGESVCAVVVTREGHASPTLEELRGLASSAGLARHKFPARVIVTDALPRTSAGKVRKRDLRPLVSGDESPGSAQR